VLVAQNDEAKLVDLWLRRDEGPPRSYETRLDERMKKTLREARIRSFGANPHSTVCKSRKDSLDLFARENTKRGIGTVALEKFGESILKMNLATGVLGGSHGGLGKTRTA
jgi:hypothetical protein